MINENRRYTIKKVKPSKVKSSKQNKESKKIKREDNYTGCTICGKPLIYDLQLGNRTCAICNKKFLSNATCLDGHFVCDNCHGSGTDILISVLVNSQEKSPFKLLNKVFKLPGIHMHGPEHHLIVPCVLLTVFYNNGGEINLEKALGEAMRRGKQVIGGICGFWGVCGAAVGTGIYASIVTGSNPLNASKWHIPQQLTSQTMLKIAEVGGPRCCKRTSFIAISEAIKFTKEKLGLEIPDNSIKCAFFTRNKECLKARCPFYGGVE